jgi:hypothetical protein
MCGRHVAVAVVGRADQSAGLRRAAVWSRRSSRTLPEPEQTELTIGLSDRRWSVRAALAVEAGIFEKYGIDAEYTVFEGDARVAAALQAGQVDVALHGTSSAISSQLTDAPFTVVAVNAVILTDDLVCQSGIDTAEEVKGKSIAFSSFGGTNAARGTQGSARRQRRGDHAVAARRPGLRRSRALDRLRGHRLEHRAGHDRSGFAIAINLKTEQIPVRPVRHELLGVHRRQPEHRAQTVAAVLEAQTPSGTIPTRPLRRTPSTRG